MLAGTIIEKGKLSIPNRYEDFEDSLIIEAMQAINDIIEEQFDYEEYNQTKRIEMRPVSISEPVMNSMQLASKKYLSGGGVDFYSHSKNIDVKRINIAFGHYLSVHERRLEFNGLEIEYDYQSTKIHASGAVDKRDVILTTQYTVNDSGTVITKDKVRYNKMINKLDIKDWEKRTNLLVFDGVTHKGVVNLHFNLAKLYSRPQEETKFDGFKDKNTQLVAKLCEKMYSGDSTTNYIIEPGNFLDLNESESGKNLMFGRVGLVDYMKNVSPILIKEVMAVSN